MRKLLLILLLSAWASATTTVTGTVQTLGTGNVASGAYVRFWLRGCGGNQPRVNGTGIIAPTQGAVYYFDFPVNASGQVSGTIYSTRDSTGLLGGDIECGGSHTSVWYGMQVFTGGKGGPEVAVHAKNTGTLDVSSVSPITVNPVIPSPTGDGTYLRLDGGNSPVTGPVAFTNKVTATGGGIISGLYSGNPTWSGNPTFSGNITSSGTNSFTGSNSFTATGVFTDSAVNQFLSANLNSLNFLTEYQAMQGSHGLTAPIIGGVSVPNTATALINAGLAGFANTNIASGVGLPDALGVYGQARCLVNSAHCLGANFAVKDAASLTTGVNIVGMEIDLDPQNGPSAYGGMVGSTVVLGPLASNDYANFRAYDVAIGNAGGTIGVGYGTENGTSDSAFSAGALCTGSNTCSSQPYIAVGLNSGVNATSSWHSDSAGDFVIVPKSGALVSIGGPPQAAGAAAGLSGTGACATFSNQVGESWAGSAKCTGTSGASTLVITPGATAANGWICNVQDETTRANLFQQTGHNQTTCTLTITSVTQNDVFVFSAIAF